FFGIVHVVFAMWWTQARDTEKRANCWLVVSFEEWSCHLVGCHDHTPLQSMCLMTLNAVLAHHRGDDFFRDVPRLRDVLV
ncbi:UNVERIFIED_CONTAM: hypothetical protein NY603_39500, partial [Bacteroidetes bacterium 56_B9]